MRVGSRSTRRADSSRSSSTSPSPRPTRVDGRSICARIVRRSPPRAGARRARTSNGSWMRRLPRNIARSTGTRRWSWPTRKGETRASRWMCAFGWTGSPSRGCTISDCSSASSRTERARAAVAIAAWLALASASAQAQDLIFSSLDAPPADPGAFSTLSCRLAYDEDGASTNYRTFQIRLVPPPGWQALAGEKTVSLAPGDARIVPFTVRVPEQASPDSIYDATFLLSDPGTGAVSGIAIRGVAVNGRHGIALLPSAEELEVRAGQRVDVSVLARNEGNQTEIISIDAESVPAWPVRVEPNEVTLAPGESRALFVHVDVPATARDGALHVLDLTASPRDADFASTRARVRTEVLE